MLTFVQPKAASSYLIDAYYQSVHSSFPIFDRAAFITSQRTKSSKGKVTSLQYWYATVNLVSAIGARFVALVQSTNELPEGCLPDLTYFSKAWAICRDRLFLSGVSVECVQVAGLMSLYLLCVNQVERYHLSVPAPGEGFADISRSWRFSGMAIRTAVALNLHMRNKSSTVAETCSQGKLWWAVYGLDCTIARMMGRASAFDHRICTVPLSTLPDNHRQSRSADVEEPWRQPVGAEAIELPSSVAHPSSLSIADDQAYFCCYKLLNTLGQEAISEIYKPIQRVHVQGRLLETIEHFNQRLDKWRLGLPGIFEFRTGHDDHEVLQRRLCLGAAFYSIRIIINRPCLCIRDSTVPKIARAVCKIGSNCVQAAKNMLKLFTLQPADAPYLCVPFWSFEHYLLQSITVITTEVLRPEFIVRQDEDDGLPLCKQAVQWLQNMAGRNQVAAFGLVKANEMLRRAALRTGAYVDDMPVADSSNDLELDQPVEGCRRRETASGSSIHGLREIMPPQVYAMFDDLQTLDSFGDGSIPLPHVLPTSTVAEMRASSVPGWTEATVECAGLRSFNER